MQVLFVCESIKFGDANIDETGKLTFVSALSRESVAEGPRTGDPEVYLVSAAQVSVRPPAAPSQELITSRSALCMSFMHLAEPCAPVPGKQSRVDSPDIV